MRALQTQVLLEKFFLSPQRWFSEHHSQPSEVFDVNLHKASLVVCAAVARVTLDKAEHVQLDESGKQTSRPPAQ